MPAAEYSPLSKEGQVQHGDITRFPTSIYALFAMLIITDIVWVAVVMTWAYERNNELRYVPIGHPQGEADNYAASALILWAILIVALLIDTGLVPIIGAHRAVVNGPMSPHTGVSVRGAEVCVAIIVFIGIFAGAGWVLALYSYMFANCGDFVFCCTVAPVGTCSSGNTRTSFLVQFSLAVIGTALALLVGIWTIVEANGNLHYNEANTDADYPKFEPPKEPLHND
jgi:hypothetical protein